MPTLMAFDSRSTSGIRSPSHWQKDSCQKAQICCVRTCSKGRSLNDQAGCCSQASVSAWLTSSGVASRRSACSQFCQRRAWAGRMAGAATVGAGAGAAGQQQRGGIVQPAGAFHALHGLRDDGLIQQGFGGVHGDGLEVVFHACSRARKGGLRAVFHVWRAAVESGAKKAQKNSCKPLNTSECSY